MSGRKTVFLFDVDNTLLDNDRITADLKQHLARTIGDDRKERYWSIFEQRRVELGYVDYLGALQQYRIEYPRDPHVLTVSHFLINYPFTDRLFPGALSVIRHVAQWGTPVILSDGDVVFQPHKIERAGLFDAVAGHVLIYIHKEEELEDVHWRFAADHYVLIDDKIRILAACKKVWGDRVTTVFPRQGHYALDREDVSRYPPADLTLDRIADLLAYELSGTALRRREGASSR